MHSLFLKEITLFSEINKSSSDDQPSPGICESKYVEDAKAARSVRVWDRVPIKIIGTAFFKRFFSLERLKRHHQMPGRSWRAGALEAVESP